MLYSTMSGLTKKTTDTYLMQATLEKIFIHIRDILQSMQSDTGHPITALHVDGNMTKSDTFLKILTNVCHLPVGKLFKLNYKHFRSKVK